MTGLEPWTSGVESNCSVNYQFVLTKIEMCWKVEMKEQLEVTDLKGNKIGVMNVSEYLLNLFTNLYYICPQNASYIKWKYMEDHDFYQEDY